MLIVCTESFRCLAGNHVDKLEQRLIMRVFLSAEWGSTKTGEQEQLIVTALNCVLQVPRYIPQEQRFDVRVLVRFSSTLQNIFSHSVGNFMYVRERLICVFCVVCARVWVY